jgi:hypothetical protein
MSHPPVSALAVAPVGAVFEGKNSGSKTDRSGEQFVKLSDRNGKGLVTGRTGSEETLQNTGDQSVGADDELQNTGALFVTTSGGGFWSWEWACAICQPMGKRYAL